MYPGDCIKPLSQHVYSVLFINQCPAYSAGDFKALLTGFELRGKITSLLLDAVFTSFAVVTRQSIGYFGKYPGSERSPGIIIHGVPRVVSDLHHAVHGPIAFFDGWIVDNHLNPVEKLFHE